MVTILICVTLLIIIQVGILLFFKGGTTIRKDGEDDETSIHNIDK